ncbi:hypothetical protein PHET_10577 [Paragonimus heterotremus]|uniref:Uncharacterized protein n=1 Tax=Paragonimus heterotremus TaxID=100268 RepID=A0A8J4T1H8_9TREM|nr:hypothetical protein PHET_10577 [Paragonimus heterotremus]
MLRGARVPFRPDLKPWLIKPVMLPERVGRRSSLIQQLSNLSSQSGSLTPSERRLSDGSGLLENLRLHAGLNCSAKSVWEFLRSKSYELLVKLEQELDADMRATFDAFVRERVLRGEEKPPLCDFVRENHSHALSNTMRNLKAPRMEKQFRKLRAMVSWAERNQDQFRIAAFQHDLKDMLTDDEISKLVSEKLGKRPPIQPGFCVISQAEADQISGFLPQTHARQNLGPLEKAKPVLEDLFPEETLKMASGKSTHKQVDYMRRCRPGPKDAERIPQPDQPHSRFLYVRPSGRPYDETENSARPIESL